MKYVMQIMLAMYAIVFVVAIFSIMGCSKYHDQSVESPKKCQVDVQIKKLPQIPESEDADLSEMQEFPEAELVEDLPIKIYHVTFYT